MMVSGFLSREFGFGFGVTKDELSLVNLKRSTDEYSIPPSCADLLGLNKAKCKTELTEDRAIEYFNFGRGTGYWKSEHMAIQFEDLNDILDAVPRFSSFCRIFLFDWSSGHAKALDDGLKVKSWRYGNEVWRGAD